MKKTSVQSYKIWRTWIVKKRRVKVLQIMKDPQAKIEEWWQLRESEETKFTKAEYKCQIIIGWNSQKWTWFVFYHRELVVVASFIIIRWFQKGSTNLSCNKISRLKVKKPLPKGLFAENWRQASCFKWYLGKFPLTPMPVEWNWNETGRSATLCQRQVGRNIFCLSFSVCTLSKNSKSIENKKAK